MSTPRAAPGDAPSMRQIVSIAAPNLVPLVGVYFLGWSASNLLILYSLDTVLAIGALAALGNIYAVGLPGRVGNRGSLGWASGIVFMFVIALLIAVPFAVWTFLLLAPFGWSVKATLADHRFVRGAVIQTGLAIMTYIQGYRWLARRSDAALVLKQRTVFTLGRYVIMLLAGIAGLEIFGLLPRESGGELQGFLLVGVYVLASTVFELSPGILSALVGETGGPAGSSRAGANPSFEETGAAIATTPQSVLIAGFIIGVALLAWGGRRLWSTLRPGASAAVSPVGGWIFSIGLLLVGLWLVFRAGYLARRRGK